ncbi:hypothetical protein ACLFMI_25420 [Pseudonocardia nantongensis]|uniref:hypothetical protein n=1 Tax=Pseudonocardia nantongensis TaxID=1181885 RepID=UPI00397E0A88
MTDPAEPVPAGPTRDPVAANRRRQRELYGEPLGERVHRLLAALGITQARLASVLGLSPAMLSQLSGARRVKIGDPAVLGRMAALDRRVACGPVPPDEVAALLDRVRAAGTPWGPAVGCRCALPDPAGGPGVSGPAARPVARAGTSGRAPGTATAPPGARIPAPRRPSTPPGPSAEDALRGVTPPARLVAAAATLAASFPEIAEVLRRAAARR